MKTHTQQQTNLEKETTATEPKLSSRKRLEYRPRKWRGNTLVPVIIALAISAIATVAFLNQGANLAQDNKIILAQNEISSIMNTWNVLRTSHAIDDIENAGTLTGSQVEIPGSILKVNVYGTAATYAATDGSQSLDYTTEAQDVCERLEPTVKKILGVSATTCSGGNVLTITLK